ncbi:MAG TPA: hypothetical protein VEO94_06280, partial [Candidatus Dormibacteraeota bacterium]|nr:hypothetical protein [Candidatus Dormibacteraeota bacterium]
MPDQGHFDRSGGPFGTASVVLEFGSLRMRLDDLSRLQAESLARRFRRFVVAGEKDPSVSIALRRAVVERFLEPRCDGTPETYRLECRRREGSLDLWSYEFAGRLDTSSGEAELALVAETGELFDRGLENFLRALTASLILERGGLLLHASGVVRGGRAYMFFGPSGRGKTTVTILSPGDVVLSDDLSLIVRNGDRFEAAGVPFGMAHQRIPDTNASFPIASLNALSQGPQVRRERLTGAAAVAAIVASLPFVMQETG